MEKQFIKQRASFQRDETLSDEPPVRVTVGNRPFDVFRQQTETEIVFRIMTPGPGSPQPQLTISHVHKWLQSIGDEGFERFSLEILDAHFRGEFCNITTLNSTFERLVHAYQAYLLSLAYQILENWHAAEDVVQEAWAKTFASLKRRCELGERVDMSHIRGFLGVVVRNAAYTYRKREHYFHFIPLESPDGEKIGELEAIEGDKFEQPEFHFIQNESCTGLGILLQCLPINYRMVIVLRFYYDHSYEETAEILRCPIGTVKCYQSRALRMLRRAVQGRGVISEDFDVWSEYSRRDSWLWSHMMRYKEAENIA